jgi:hypothetical protein
MALIVTMMLSSFVFAQSEQTSESLKIEVTEATEINVTHEVTVSQVMIGEKPIGVPTVSESDPVEKPSKPVAVMRLSGFDEAACSVSVACDDSECSSYAVDKSTYVFNSPGTHKVFISVTNWDSKFQAMRWATVKVGNGPNPPPKPDDPDVPTPDVPVDNYGNIGQRVAVWAAGLPKTKEVANVYKNVANDLLHNAASTVNSATQKLNTERNALLGADAGKYQPLIDKTNEDLKSRWPMARGVYAEYLLAISRGLEGAR